MKCHVRRSRNGHSVFSPSPPKWGRGSKKLLRASRQTDLGFHFLVARLWIDACVSQVPLRLKAVRERVERLASRARQRNVWMVAWNLYRDDARARQHRDAKHFVAHVRL